MNEPVLGSPIIYRICRDLSRVWTYGDQLGLRRPATPPQPLSAPPSEPSKPGSRSRTPSVYLCRKGRSVPYGDSRDRNSNAPVGGTQGLADGREPTPYPKLWIAADSGSGEAPPGTCPGYGWTARLSASPSPARSIPVWLIQRPQARGQARQGPREDQPLPGPRMAIEG